MKQVWKYTIDLQGTTHKIPKGGKILHVGEQFGNICIWIEVDPKEHCEENRVFEVFGTGHPIEELSSITQIYLGTVKLSRGRLVFHIYEYKEIE